MNDLFSMGGLIPLWILGAPLVAAVIMGMSTPRHARSDMRDTRSPAATRSPLPPSGTGAPRL